ncbi:M1 family metallopeptidase [Candidatus Palauibacter sp.]|uniref:M1 family metallopeptidase n=1 Tax=Candidatus Palauibacter sp. TaxID=3101350 RepID=UPI003B017E71
MKYALPLLLVSSLTLGSTHHGSHPTSEPGRPGPEPSRKPPSERALDTYPKNPAIDALNYAFALTLSDETDVISGEATIDLRFLEAGIEEVRLDLIEEKPDGTGMRVRGVAGADGPLEFEHREDALFISLAPPVEAGERRRVTVAYEGVPATGLIIGPNKHGDRTFFSDNWPNKARNWLPTIDHPYDKAASELIVTAPAHYQVISNGLLIEETDLLDGTRRSHWKQSVPIATWLYSLGVARFAVQTVDFFRGIPIQTWVYAQDRDAGFHDFAVPTKQAMEFYEDMVGPYSYEKLANVQSNSVGGGMEAATAIFYGDASVTGERDVRWRNVIIHEVAHQWFGNSVTEYDWDDIWLSEGFATYFTLLFIEHQYGRDEFIERLKVSRDRIRDFMAVNPDYRVVHDNLSDMGLVTSGPGTYQKGSWTLHMLRGVVGEDAFWTGIQAYYREFRDGSATTADFRRAMEEASGLDLRTFFDQWLYRGGWLEYEGGWSYDAAAGAIHVDIRQTQDERYTFRMPVEIAIHLPPDGPLERGVHGATRPPRFEVIDVEGREGRFTIPVPAEPLDVVFDPNTWLLMDAAFERR